jgi:Cu-Zn family superoxide dismutase
MHVRLHADELTITAHAHAVINGKAINGTADFVEYDIQGAKYVHLRLELSGDPKILQPGKHAVHIHEKGGCDCEGFTCAGGHFDPGPFGNTDPDANHGYHAGDLPNIVIDDSGNGTLEAITTRITLSNGPISILDQPDGTSLMIHAHEDPHTPGESGSGHSGGSRLACGTILRDKM